MGVPMGTLRDGLGNRYRNDPRFRELVDAICAMAVAGNITTHELRDACYMAALKAESLRPFPNFYTDEEINSVKIPETKRPPKGPNHSN